MIQPDRLEKYFKSLDIVFIAMLGGQILFMLVSYFLVREGKIGESQDSASELKIISIIVTIGLVISSKFIAGIILRQTGDNIEKNLALYRNLTLLRLALVEAAVLINIIVFMLIHAYLYLLIALLLLVLFFAYRPSKVGMIKEMKLDRNMLN
jgi:hypothetical protein